MEHTKDHNCHCQSLCPECDYGPFTRNHYFTGKLLVERDFKDEQRFHIEKLRHHHQRLHGWGVVCGFKVKQHANPACRDRFVCIEPGTAIDCCGHEILLRDEECFDITKLQVMKELKKKEENDPEAAVPHTLQICVRFRECPTEQIPVLYDECGCDDTQCAPNRILESYEIDVLVDPTEQSEIHGFPKLEWANTINIAHASYLVLHEDTHRLYVLTNDDPGTIYQISIDNHAILGSRNLPTKGIALNVSNDGTRLYIVVEDGANPRRLLVLDVSGPNTISDPPIQDLEISGSANSFIFLAVARAPDDRLITLVAETGDLLVWGTDINNTGAPSSPGTISFGATDLQDLDISSDATKAYVADPANNQIHVGDVTALTPLQAINVFPAGTKPTDIAVVRSTAPDLLAVADHDNKKIHLVDPASSSLIGSVGLDHNPIELEPSAGGHWLYVLLEDGSSCYIQAVNVVNLQQGLPDVLGQEIKVGNGSQYLTITSSGQSIYVSFAGDPALDTDGGVAVIDASEQNCCDLLWRHLDGCPDCDEPNCVVLATIENYKIGNLIQDAIDPPSDPVADANNNISRINNRKGRRLLPSTQTLTEMLMCLCTSGIGGEGKQGPPGPGGPQGLPGEDGEQGDPGAPGVGLNFDLPHIVAINWRHGKETEINQFERGLIIAFDQEMLPETIHSQSIQVLVRKDEEEGTYCYCNLRGRVRPVKVINTDGDVLTKCGEKILEPKSLAPGEMATGAHFVPEIHWRPGEYWVIVKGDFVLGATPILLPNGETRSPALDANHLGPGLPNRCPTGDGVEGGTFESWFTISQG